MFRGLQLSWSTRRSLSRHPEPRAFHSRQGHARARHVRVLLPSRRLRLCRSSSTALGSPPRAATNDLAISSPRGVKVVHEALDLLDIGSGKRISDHCQCGGSAQGLGRGTGPPSWNISSTTGLSCECEPQAYTALLSATELSASLKESPRNRSNRPLQIKRGCTNQIQIREEISPPRLHAPVRD